MVAPAAESTSRQRIDLVIDQLACPLCHSAMHRVSAAIRCASGHAFDIARQGYVALLSGRSRANTADTVEMVDARERFLGRAHYAPIATAVAAALPDTVDGLCVDIAGGTGYYLGAVLDARESAVGLCIDLSTPALRRAARAHPRAAAIAADAWMRLPLRDGTASVTMSVFGPRNGSEFARVLRPGGVLVVVTPTERHLAELVEPLGMITVGTDKSARLDRTLAAFDRVSSTACEYPLSLPRPDVLDVVSMGPSARHVEREKLAAGIGELSPLTSVTVSVEVSIHRPRPSDRADRTTDQTMDHTTNLTTDRPDLGGVRTAKHAEG